MKISLDWLKDLIDLDDQTPEGLAALLTDLGLEAKVEAHPLDFTGVVVGRVLEVSSVPAADRLSLCQVDLGEELVSIVCGAPNVAQGQNVPVATVGAVLPGGFKVKKTRIRGQVSQGMICAEDELGLSDDHTGIMVLSSEAETGQDFKDYLSRNEDIVFDLDLTPNRGDCFSHLGVARDLAARLGRSLRRPAATIKEGPTPIADLAGIAISAPEACHRYAARVVTGVKVGPSPQWLVKRLETVGLRSINNIVDASNYVLMELGHPLHIFDYDLLAGQRIDVYMAREGQTFTTLDGVERRLGNHHLLIADGNGPIALAGIMGGLDSEVTGQTSNILIESAYFAPAVVRRGAKSVDLSTEASKRFERDTDIAGLIYALDRVTALVTELAGGDVAKGRIDVYPTRHEPLKIELSSTFTNRLLGTCLTADRMAAHLKALGIEVEAQGADTLACMAPLFRPELTQPVDLIEEIARLEGYDKLPAVEGIDVRFQSFVGDSQSHFNDVRRVLVPWGFHEHMSNTLTRQEYTSLFSDDQAIEIQNPLSREMAFMRTSLIPGLIQAVAFNERRKQKNIQIFEIGAVHAFDRQTYNKGREAFKLGLATALGKGAEELHWKHPEPKDLYYLKGVVGRLLEALGLHDAAFAPAKDRDLDRALTITCRKKTIGLLGEINAAVRDIFDLEIPVAVAELNLDILHTSLEGRSATYRDIVPYPVVERDIALDVPRSALAGELLETIRRQGGKVLRDARIFDLYSGQGIAGDRKSIAFRMFFQADSGTLKDQEVDVHVSRIADALEKEHKAHWRRS